MNNKGMIEYKESFISKIKNFLKRIFGKQKEQCNYVQEISDNDIKEIKQEKFVNEIKVDTKVVDAAYKKEKFLKEIEGNVEALNMLAIDKLRKLEKYYDNIIEQNENKIKKLKETA